MSAKKFVVVTGVSKGCGRALVEWLIREGHTVAGCARSAAVVDALRKEFGAPHRFDVVDVRGLERDGEVGGESDRIAWRARSLGE